MITDGVIYLRAPEPIDLEPMYEVENDRSLWLFSAVRAPMSKYRIKEFVVSYDANILATDSGRFTACRVEDNSVVGFVDYFELDAVNRRAGIGLVIRHDERGHSYGTRCISLLADYFGGELGLHSLWAVISQSNKASQASFEAAGFKSSGCLRSWIRNGQSYTDALIYQRIL